MIYSREDSLSYLVYLSCLIENCLNLSCLDILKNRPTVWAAMGRKWLWALGGLTWVTDFSGPVS